MEITVEAIYEAGVLKLLHPLPQLREHEKVQLVIQTTAQNERDRAAAVLREAGLLAEPSPGTKERAARSAASLAEVQQAFSRSPGKLLSEIVIEQRGPKE
ncbi:MAG TPA: antitoxin family protein [Acidobacteriota bacterium]|nr:antitoxin family protein [Acidobacteriota bacterium]HNB72711.1 antitoxin family protein [Acidobacteriota bacterium]HNG93469.1 antitoxin family protein [Acidobacteriota bacterium]HNH83696.1 antitoxin family protein [Acidobacteriota bacterium]HNJ42480.1 antitoxin family protein [Acidobacteriota bacterium]